MKGSRTAEHYRSECHTEIRHKLSKKAITKNQQTARRRIGIFRKNQQAVIALDQTILCRNNPGIPEVENFGLRRGAIRKHASQIPPIAAHRNTEAAHRMLEMIDPIRCSVAKDISHQLSTAARRVVS